MDLEHTHIIDLVTVFDAVLTSRQTSEKLQCLYENLMSNNFLKTAVLKKNINCKLKLQSKAKLPSKILGTHLCLNLSRGLLYSFHMFVCNFPGTFQQTNV